MPPQKMVGALLKICVSRIDIGCAPPPLKVVPLPLFNYDLSLIQRSPTLGGLDPPPSLFLIGLDPTFKGESKFDSTFLKQENRPPLDFLNIWIILKILG